MSSDAAPVRTLSKREAELMGRLEAQRCRSVRADEVSELFGWTQATTWHVLSRLADKGWLRRTAKGRYETILAETGGWAPPDPWAALSMWGQRYYVGFRSAAFELGLTPDRPGSVQTCVPAGVRRPRAWTDTPIVLVFFRRYDDAGTRVEPRHGFDVRLASTEKILVDGAALPGRMGGVLELARVLDRARDSVDWTGLVDLASRSSRAGVALRRLAALLDVLGRPVPDPLAEGASAGPVVSPLFLGERRTYGAHGERLRRWQVVVNIDPSVIREEVGLGSQDFGQRGTQPGASGPLHRV